MATAELKSNLIRLISSIENPALLEHLTEYLNAANERPDWWDGISTTQQAFVHRSARQIEQGAFVAHAVVRAEVDRLLKKA